GVYCLDQFMGMSATTGDYVAFAIVSTLIWVRMSFILLRADFFRTCAIGLASPMLGGALLTVPFFFPGILYAVMWGAVTFPIGLVTGFLVRTVVRFINRRLKPETVAPPIVRMG